VIRSTWAAALATAAVLLCGSVSAQAAPKANFSNLPTPTGEQPAKTQPDADTYVPGGLTPSTPNSPRPGGITPNTATPNSGYYTCTASVGTPIANVPAGYVTGQCMNGWNLQATEEDVLGGSWYWEGGKVNQAYDGCGWIDFAYTSWTSGSTYTACNPPSINQTDFIYYTAAGTAYIWSDSSGTDGLDHTMSRTCTLYGEYRPWASGQGPTTALHTINAGTTIKMRYMAKYVSTAGYNYVMIHDPWYGAGSGNWGFVQSGCL
jgi:hypothetical protein